MVSRIFFVVPGEPVPKARPRFTMQGGKARTYTPTSSAAYETTIGILAHAAMQGREPMQGAVAVQVQAFFPVPHSWSKKRKAAAQWHASRPDLDNVVKSALDGMNRVAFADDGQVASIYATKAYSDTPRLEVAVYEIGAKKPSECAHDAQSQAGCYCLAPRRKTRQNAKLRHCLRFAMSARGKPTVALFLEGAER